MIIYILTKIMKENEVFDNEIPPAPLRIVKPRPVIIPTIYPKKSYFKNWEFSLSFFFSKNTLLSVHGSYQQSLCRFDLSPAAYILLRQNLF